jgi:predicted CxxxxCH...CXXCH cytochrome family protein
MTGRARLDGVNASYVTATKTCNNSYCHGATLVGGKTAVVWSDGDGSESQCGACHGMPPASPAHNGQTPTGCNGCHQDTAGANATIIAPALHLDGTVQVSGGGCDSCHGSPPAPGRESYAGSAGAHQAHAGTLGFECATCHGNNGTGASHNQGNGTVSRNNVDVVFDVSVAYPGGTTMRNGGTSAYDRTARTCAVGCHNPILGNPPETPQPEQPTRVGRECPHLQQLSRRGGHHHPPQP